MSFASDKLYKGYLRRKMPTIVSTVKTSEIIPHLPCLTDHDRENIEAKRETRGNYDSMVLLLDCLKRRENWVEEFISALEECNHPTIAADIRREYDALRDNSTAGPPPAAVTTAHVHPEPSDIRLSVPETDADGEAAVPQPAVPSAPPQSAAQASPPMPPQLPETPAVPGSPPPEPVSRLQRSAQLHVVAVPTTPPPSPELQPAGAAGRSPPPPREDVSHQEPVENSEPEDIQAISEQPSRGAAPQPHGSVEQSEDDTPPQGEDLHTTAAPAEASSPPSPPPTEVDSNLTYGTTVSVMTPNRTPIQDTTPPDLEEKLPAPACAQDVDCRLHPEVAAAAAAAPLPGAAAMEDPQIESALSKPGELISVPAQPLDGLTLPEPDSSVEPYSGNTARLEISSDAERPALVAACSALASTAANTSSMLPCQENGVAVNHNEPEENHYESPSESLELQEVRESTLQICEEPSILNMDGHDSTQQGPVVNGEAAKGTISAAAAAAGAEPANSPPASEVCQPSEPAPGEGSPPAPQGCAPSHFLATNAKYFVTAAGVGAFALLLAWRFKH